MFRKKLIYTVLAGALAAPAVNAQGRAQFPVIVVFENNVRFQDFSRFAGPDAREAADPPAWGYLNRGVVGAVRYLEQRGRFRADQVFSHSVRGFAAHLSTEQIRQLETDSMVRFVEPDGVMSIGGKITTSTSTPQTVPWGIRQVGADVSSTAAGNGWGGVSNVNVYIIDTGVGDHPDLNKVGHVNFAGGQNADCHGHGTHVAGTAAAIDNGIDVVGVAPGAPITGVRVLGCNGNGSTSGVIKGVDWVTANRRLPAVANMSLGGRASNALDEAVRASAAAGVFYVLAAGNSATDACTVSPARAGAGIDNGILTVAATTADNTATLWSNYGPCVDLWAPGVGVLSTKLGGGTTTMSGTSMSSPHGAGTAALFLSSRPGFSPTAVESALKAAAINTGKPAPSSGQIVKVVYTGAY